MGTREKVVGVLGGMGPWATWSFCQRITELTQADKDWEHLRIIVDCNTKIPSRTRAVLYGEINPLDAMVTSIHGLAKAGADFAVVPSNSAHYWYQEVMEWVQIPWLNMLDVVADAIRKAKWNGPILVVGGYIPSALHLYDNVLNNVVYPSNKVQGQITAVIEQRKLDMTVPIRPLLDHLIQLYPKHLLLLACTEISGDMHYFPYFPYFCVDTAIEYAKATVEYAYGRIK